MSLTVIYPQREEGFPAIVDVLAFGNTIRLSTSPPVDRAAAEVFPMPRDVEVVYPDERALQAEALGAEPARARRARSRRSQAVVDVRAVHGNLAFARFPVAVGHYVGDTIISAEKALDRTLARPTVATPATRAVSRAHRIECRIRQPALA